ncbi:hypothetical protein J3E73DRAFT_362134 [Bipolaris maydis]|nr:hypothetical protein J3E73DRAFT_362134 [Bipolaris maydis]
MKFFTAVSAAVLGFSSMASGITVSYDPGYDDASRSRTLSPALTDPTVWLLASPPRAAFLASPRWLPRHCWNSPQCGTCYGLTYNGKTI